jgi:DNA-binding NarL/FixJ family response regulator
MFVIASNDSGTLDRWREWLHELDGIVEVRRFEALPELLALRPRLVLLDLRLARASLLQDVRQLLAMSPGTHLVAFTQECEQDHELALFRAGVRGICAIDVARDVLLRVVKAVLEGELWIRRNLVPLLIESVAADRLEAATGSTGRFSILTPREHEVSRLVGQGVSNKRIARHLAIAERTVKGHLTTIFRKIGVVDRVKLALLVAKRH